MKNNCKLLLLLAVMLAAMLSFSVVASADTDEPVWETAEVPMHLEGGWDFDGRVEACKSDLYTFLIQEQTSYFDASPYQLTMEQFREAFYSVMVEYPELFYMDGRFHYYSSGGYIAGVSFDYKEHTDEDKLFVMNSLNAVAAMVDPSWSDALKVMFVSDYLAANYTYDYNYEIYDVLGFFKNRSGVCQAYTSAVCGILKRVGIDVATADSDAMNHVWNIVKVDGQWYHLDVTWNDPGRQAYGRSGKNNLLLSDEGITNAGSGHHDWVLSRNVEIAAEDHPLNAFLNEMRASTSPFVYMNGEWYFITFAGTRNSWLKKTSDFVNVTDVLDISDTWVAGSTSYWNGYYSGLSKIGDSLYFNNSHKIMRYTPETGAIRVILEEDDPVMDFFGSGYDGLGHFYYTLQKGPSASVYTAEELDLNAATVTPIGANMNVSDELNLQFFFNIVGNAEPILTFTNEENVTFTQPLIRYIEQGKEMYSMVIDPSMLGDLFTIEVKVGENVIFTKSGYGVVTYCDNLHGISQYASDTKLMTLMANMLEFGTKAQFYKNYRTESAQLANRLSWVQPLVKTYEGVTGEVKSGVNTNPEIATVTGVALQLTDKIQIGYQVTREPGEYLKTDVRTGDGTRISKTLSQDTEMVYSQAISYCELSKVVEITLSSKNVMFATYRLNVPSYVKSALSNPSTTAETQEMLKAMIVYGNLCAAMASGN